MVARTDNVITDNMNGQILIPKPKNWQDFEQLCKVLWGEIWNCADTIQLNGRLGQTQNGVDICAYIHSEKGYYCIQCKCKEDHKN